MAEPSSEIDEVIDDLEDIVAECRDRSDRAGYFAAMYLEVTKEIKRSVDAGRFDDAARTQQAGGTPTESWQVAFDAATKRRPIIVQQLLVGVNAHINLDLGIAAAAIAPGSELPPLKADFDTINDVLASMTERFTTDIGRVSPWIAWLNRIGGRAEHEIIRFSIDLARENAWKLATELAPIPPDEWDEIIGRRDAETAILGDAVIHPGRLLSVGLFIIRLRETNDVAKVIDVLVRLMSRQSV